ncbi:MAG: glycosyltransferase family 2 protein, partial [Salinivenus sp.]
MDDGSTDATPARLADCRDPRLQVIRLETNVGRAVAKNHALERVRGSYVAFMDGDDESEPHRLQVQVAFLGQQGLRFVPGHYVEDHELWTQALRTAQFANLPDVLLNHHHVLADRVEDTRAKERGIMPVVLSQVRALGIRPTDRQRQPVRSAAPATERAGAGP